MAGLDPAIHALLRLRKDVDARDKPGHDDLNCCYRQCNSRISSQPITLPTASPNTDRITTPASS